MYFLLTQLIGAIGFIAIVLSYFKEEKKKILFMQIIAYLLFTIHYYLLSGITGAICNFIGLFALLTIYMSEKYHLKYKNILAIFFAILLIIINIASFQNAFSIFPMVASVIVIISFLTDNEDIIRGIGLISAVCWFIYAIAYKSYISIIFETLTLIGTCVAFIKNTSNYEITNKSIFK